MYWPIILPTDLSHKSLFKFYSFTGYNQNHLPNYGRNQTIHLWIQVCNISWAIICRFPLRRVMSTTRLAVFDIWCLDSVLAYLYLFFDNSLNIFTFAWTCKTLTWANSRFYFHYIFHLFFLDIRNIWKALRVPTFVWFWGFFLFF